MVDYIHKNPKVFLTFPQFPFIRYDKKVNNIEVNSTNYKIQIIKFNNKKKLKSKRHNQINYWYK